MTVEATAQERPQPPELLLPFAHLAIFGLRSASLFVYDYVMKLKSRDVQSKRYGIRLCSSSDGVKKFGLKFLSDSIVAHSCQVLPLRTPASFTH